VVGVAIRANGHLEEAFLQHAARIVLEDRHLPLLAHFLDGRKSRNILIGLVVIARACRGRVTRIVVRAEDRIVLACDGKPHRLAGDVLHAQPGLEDQCKINDSEQDDQQDRQRERELHQRLR
jgi:hypothetical protein